MPTSAEQIGTAKTAVKLFGGDMVVSLGCADSQWLFWLEGTTPRIQAKWFSYGAGQVVPTIITSDRGADLLVSPTVGMSHGGNAILNFGPLDTVNVVNTLLEASTLTSWDIDGLRTNVATVGYRELHSQLGAAGCR